jgi:hypothetical protein
MAFPSSSRKAMVFADAGAVIRRVESSCERQEKNFPAPKTGSHADEEYEALLHFLRGINERLRELLTIRSQLERDKAECNPKRR